jgi:2-polyprenyl-3-methyl-5-hydroxy-6-metoxy-1,4-benzoquinol methylase
LKTNPAISSESLPAPVPDPSLPSRGAVVERNVVRGVVFVHRAAGLAIEPRDWRLHLVAALRRIGGAGLVGAKRLDDAGRVFSMGERVVHPKGFHHVGKGAPGSAFRFPDEVDAVAGGVMAVDAAAFDAGGGEARCAGELGLLALGLAVRARGLRCVTVPSAAVTDAHAPAPAPGEEDAFAERFGFDWMAADMDDVARRHRGTGLLWDARFQGEAMPFDKYEDRPAVHWTSYETAETYRARADHLARLVARLAEGGRVLDLGCGDGLFTHLAAMQKVNVVGLDPEERAIEQARERTARQAYPGTAPAFARGAGDAMPFEDGAFDLVFALDVIEHLRNPVAVLREIVRVLAPCGRLLLTTPAWQLGAWSDPTYHVTEYAPEELVRQVEAVNRRGTARLKAVQLGRIGGVYRDIVLVAQRR